MIQLVLRNQFWTKRSTEPLKIKTEKFNFIERKNWGKARQQTDKICVKIEKIEKTLTF